MNAPDYYTSPASHPRQIELNAIQDQIDAAISRMMVLESLDRDYTDQEEDEYYALEDRVSELTQTFQNVTTGE